MSQVAELSIPKYSLGQLSNNRSNLFDVIEFTGKSENQPDMFLTPHRRDFYMLVFIKAGSNRHWIDMVPYVIKPETFYFTVPHQIQLKEKSEPAIGKMIRFTDEFLAMEENEFLRALPIIQNLQNGHELTLNADNVLFIEDIMGKIVAEHKQQADWRNGMLLAYLRVLLIYVSRLYNDQFNDGDAPADRLILKKFRALLNEYYIEKHDVAAYADLLNISAGHLGEVIKQQSGKNAIELIHERLMLEARRMLFHTENSIKEIAFELGFEDASYFNRFFKRISGQTPLVYRTGTRKMYH
jgi:AraC family transcriptional activator of pobA